MPANNEGHNTAAPSVQSESELKARRGQRRAQLFTSASGALLIVSLVAIVACTRRDWSSVVPYLMWNHVAIIVVFGIGALASRRLPPMKANRVSPRLGDLFAPWVLVTALVAATVALPNWVASPWDAGKEPDGSAATSRHWHASPDGQRFYESVNRGPEREISQAEYEELQRSLYSGFARMWVLFSFMSLLMWRFIALRWQSELTPAGPEPQPVEAQATHDAASARGGIATALIVALWTLAIGTNLLSFVLAPEEQLCPTPLPPEMRLFGLLVPPLFFGGFALFARHSPFLPQWIAGLINQKLGAGASEAFMARLRPLLLFAVGGLIGAVKMVIDCAHAGAGSWGVAGFLASGSISFALAHFILRRRRVPGV